MIKKALFTGMLFFICLTLSVPDATSEMFPYAKILTAEKVHYTSTIGKGKKEKPYVYSINEYSMIFRKGRRFTRAIGKFIYPDNEKVLTA